MKLLMMTPAIDETQDLYGFIASWVRKIAERVDKLYVITYQHRTETPLPDNVTVYGINRMGTVRFGSLVRRLTRAWNLNIAMLQTVPRVDAIFCHMHPRLTIWAAPYAKLFRIPIVTWYSHAHVSGQLRLAHFLSDRVVTASEDSLNIKSSKVIVTGHGIDTDKFTPPVNREKRSDKRIILSLGRISPVKDCATLVRAADILVNRMNLKNIEVLLVGGAPAAHEEYYQSILRMVDEFKLKDFAKFVGTVPWVDTVKYYQACDIFVNMLSRGGVGKATAEAMACEKPVVVCSEPYRDLLRPYDELCLFKPSDPESMAEKLANLLANERLWPEIGKVSRQKVVESHSINRLADKLVGIFQKLVAKEKRR